MIFKNRIDAGDKLADKITDLKLMNPIILTLPRGGVPVGFEIAKRLNAPLDVLVVRKIGLKDQKEFGIGAIAEGGVVILDQSVIKYLGIALSEIEISIKSENKELKRRVKVYRNNKKLPKLINKIAILVDDGVATGVTMNAAIKSVKKLHPRKIVVAVPVCVRDLYIDFLKNVDDVICLEIPYELKAVGLWYETFEQLTDEEVVNILKKTTN